jgi:hypothetical protein
MKHVWMAHHDMSGCGFSFNSAAALGAGAGAAVAGALVVLHRRSLLARAGGSVSAGAHLG